MTQIIRGPDLTAIARTLEGFPPSREVIMVMPPPEELFEEFQSAFLANAAYRFRSRKQFWPISAHNHLLLKTGRARVMKPQRSAHFSNRYCQTASPETLEARLKQLTDGTTRMVCINYLEVIVDKVPDAMRYLSEATGPAAPFENPRTKAYAAPSRKRPFARLGSTLSEGFRDIFVKPGDRHDEKAAPRSVR
jgi:hypothetical protein